LCGLDLVQVGAEGLERRMSVYYGEKLWGFCPVRATERDDVNTENVYGGDLSQLCQLYEST
jgi:hypothetical protein